MARRTKKEKHEVGCCDETDDHRSKKRMNEERLVSRDSFAWWMEYPRLPGRSKGTEEREERARGVGVRWDRAKGTKEHALWADLEKVVEVQEAALVGATSIKPEVPR